VPNIALQQKPITILIHLCALLSQPHIQQLNIVLQQGHITTRELSHALPQHLQPQPHLTALLSTVQAPDRSIFLDRSPTSFDTSSIDALTNSISSSISSATNLANSISSSLSTSLTYSSA
jgi:hypothetical protein